jgi:hypothetical protein
MKTFIPSEFIVEQYAGHFDIDGQKILTHKFIKAFPLCRRPTTGSMLIVGRDV